MAVATSAAASDTSTRAGWETPSAAALTWITAGSVFLGLGGLLYVLTAAQQVAPGLYTINAATSFGRLRPAAEILVIFGGLGMLGAGLALDITRRLARATVQLDVVAKAAGALTTAGVLASVTWVLSGHSTGRAGVEMGRPLAVVLALGQVLVAAVVLRTLAVRTEDGLHPALWFIVTGVVAAPIVLLLGVLPGVAGVNDEIVASFAVSGLRLLWLLPLAVGVALYTVPAASRAALDSRPLALLAYAFWIVAAPFAGPARLLGSAAPEWLETVGIAASILLVVPLLAVVVLLLRTYARRTSLAHDAALRWSLAGVGLLALFALVQWTMASRVVNDWLGATVAVDALRELPLAVCGLLLLGAAFHVLPVLTGNHLSSPYVAALTAWPAVLGAVVLTLALLVGGYVQGAIWHTAVATGADTLTGDGWQVVTDATRPLLWLRVIGEALLAGGWLVGFQQVLSTSSYGEPLGTGD